MTNQTLASTAVDILQQPGIRKINFAWGGLVVTGERFIEVGKAITKGDIECRVVKEFPSNPAENLDSGMVTVAQYQPEQDAMLFSSEDYGKSSGKQKAAIVHEATHAMFDLFARSHDDRFFGIDDEAAAVLAEAFYIRLCEIDAPGFSQWIDGPGDLALKLVDEAIKQTERHKFSGQYFFYAGLPKVAKFRQVVAEWWKLIKKGDSDRSRVLSIYDGVPCRICRQSVDAVIKNSGGQKAGAAMRPGTKIY